MREYLFMQSKLKRQIDWNGQEFHFTHVGEDKYHRGSEETDILVRGIYHQATSYKQKNSSDGTVTSTKAKPMILCMYEDGSAVSVGDKISLNDQDMFVSGVENVQELNVAIEISLEVNE